MRIHAMSRPAAAISFSDDRNIIFRLAGNDARIAADARVEVDHHSPCVTCIVEFAGIIESFARGRKRFAAFENISPMNAVGVLRRGE